MGSAILSVRGLTKCFGAHLVSDNIYFDLIASELHAVIGPNGAGKTTLINQLVGELTPDAGVIYFNGRDITALPVYQRSLLGFSRSYQITSVFSEFTALENVSIAAQAHDGHSYDIWYPAAREEALTRPALAALEKVGLADKAHLLVSELGHGERRQLELAMALVSKSKILLLDEPMAGMGPRESESMVQLLSTLKVSVC
jgi:branched-chain amino acid transport system ATP-binding protein